MYRPLSDLHHRPPKHYLESRSRQNFAHSLRFELRSNQIEKRRKNTAYTGGPPQLISFIISRPGPKIINEISSIFPAPCIHSSHRTLPHTTRLLTTIKIVHHSRHIIAISRHYHPCLTAHTLHCVRAWEPLSLVGPAAPVTRSDLGWLGSDGALRLGWPSQCCGECGV